MTVGVVSAGSMGSAVGAALASGGERCVTTLSGRSERTARLARRAGLELLPDLASVVRSSEVVLSIVPPEAAGTVVVAIADSAEQEGVSPIVADLNAVAPATTRAAQEVADTSAVANSWTARSPGPPPWNPGTTRIYLSGARAAEVADLPFDGVDTDRRRARGRIGVGGEDEHRVRLQGELRAPSPGAPRGPGERRPRPRARGPAARGTRARRERRATPRNGRVEVRALRRRDARDRRDTGGCRAHAVVVRSRRRCLRIGCADRPGSTQPRGRRDRHRCSRTSSTTCARRRCPGSSRCRRGGPSPSQPPPP